MATGVNKKERVHPEDIITPRLDLFDPPLPLNNVEVKLEYKRKASLKSILSPAKFNFSKFNKIEFINCSGIKANSFVFSDNLFALKDLVQNGTKVDLIYIDPPYGTGLEFVSRSLEPAYRDNLGTAAYIEYMRRRLILMREILSEEGSIYVHIGHQMLAYMKILLDEIFGSNNFRNIITRRKCSSKNYTKKQYLNLNDYVLFYSKTSNYKWNQPGAEPSDEWVLKEYPKEDKKGRYKLVPIHAPGVRNGKTGEKWREMSPPTGKHWQYIPEKLEEFDLKGEIHWSKNGNPRRKVYFNNDKKLPLSDYWHDYRDAHHQSVKITGYPTEKNFEMLKMIVEASSQPGDIVFDPFCGSGTTLHAAAVLNRQWIGVDQSITAANAVIKRLLLGILPMGDYVQKNTKKIKIKPDLINSDFDFIIDNYLLNQYKKEIDEIIDIF